MMYPVIVPSSLNTWVSYFSMTRGTKRLCELTRIRNLASQGCNVPEMDANCAGRKLIPLAGTHVAARRQPSLKATSELRRCANHVKEEEADGDESGRQTLERSHAHIA